MRWPRFALRWLMIAAAVSGVLLGLSAVAERNRTRASWHRSKLETLARRTGVVVDSSCKHEFDCFGGWQCGHCEAKLNGLISHHLAIVRKYERAASYPWLPVAPDPPEPK